jgi:DNA primase
MGHLTNEIRAQVKISDILGSYYSRIDCPKCHRIKTASVINDEYVFCHSASCGFKANSIQLNALINLGDDSLTKESIYDLCDRYGIRRNVKLTAEQEKKLQLLREVRAVYMEDLFDSPLVLQYLTDRRNIKNSTLQEIGVGYASGTSLKSAFRRTELIEAGLLSSSTNKEFFKTRVMFPLVSDRGHITSFVGRYVGPPSDYIPRYKNLSTTIHTLVLEQFLSLYNKKDMLCVCEGFMDTISLYELGMQSCGILGVYGLLNYAHKLTKFNSICFCFDSDRDEETGRYKSYTALIPQLINLVLLYPHNKYYVYLPKRKDINEELCNGIISRQSILRDKWPLCDFLLDSLFDDKKQHVQLIRVIEALNSSSGRNKFYELIGSTAYDYLIDILDVKR